MIQSFISIFDNIFVKNLTGIDFTDGRENIF